MNKSKLLIAAAVASMSFSQVASADAGGDNWSISGWINEGISYYDDGRGSDVVQNTDNGTTLASRVTLAGSTELPNTGLTAGFELILEPQAGTTPLLSATQATFGDQSGHGIGVLGNSAHLAGSFGKITIGLQSMPTDNIAVLEDPSLTLWSSISPLFRWNAFTIQGVTGVNTTWGHFATCSATGVAIGIDCNGVYRQGVRYDLPAFGPVTVAVGYSNDDIYDIAAKYKGELAGIKTQFALGYSIHQSLGAPTAAGTIGTTGADGEVLQMQLGLMDPGTGIFGTFAYSIDETDSAAAGAADDGDAYYLKVGIKKAFNSLGDTSLAFIYGSYNDQWGNSTAEGITGSEIERIGFSVDQYFGSRFIVYGLYENLDLDVDGAAAGLYGGAEDLDTFTLGTTFFF